MMRYRVIKTRKADSENPLKLEKGEHVLIKGGSKKTDWPGWLFCESKDNQGWVPEQLVHRNSDLGSVIMDYDATEFDLELGEVIVRDYELNGWIWGYKKGNPEDFGWIPKNHIERIQIK